MEEGNCKKYCKLSNKSIINGVTDRAVVYAKNNIVKNNLFLLYNDIDPLTAEAANYKIKPFQNGWVKSRVMESRMVFRILIDIKKI